MLEQLFSSRTRVKLLSLFLTNPENDYFVRQLTRLLSEQINSIRRELDNLKKVGLLKSRTQNRKKYFRVNKNFIIFDELSSIFSKTSSSSSEIVNDLKKLGALEKLILTGTFTNITAPVDLLIIGNFHKDNLSQYVRALENNIGQSLSYSCLSKEDYQLRVKCKDKFLDQVLSSKHNVLFSTFQ